MECFFFFFDGDARFQFMISVEVIDTLKTNITVLEYADFNFDQKF